MKSESEVAQSCPTLSDPMDCSLTGSSVHGIFQARVLEWGAIAFSKRKKKEREREKKMQKDRSLMINMISFFLFTGHGKCIGKVSIH